jgi:hypothetical protein
MSDMTAGTSRVERYLAHLDALSDDVEPEFWPVESTKPGLKGVTAIGYRGLPEPGMLLGLTYGLSLVDHELWQHGKPELCICVQSEDPLWVLAVATLAEQLRGDCPFQYGDTLSSANPSRPAARWTASLCSHRLLSTGRMRGSRWETTTRFISSACTRPT